MTKDSLNTILKYFAFAIPVFIIGMITGGYIIDNERKPTKTYPIDVRCCWTTSQAASYPTMEADSVKGDTIYNDGIYIVNKNIINIQFK
jgi:hypothetical protein